MVVAISEFVISLPVVMFCHHLTMEMQNEIHVNNARLLPVRPETKMYYQMR